MNDLNSISTYLQFRQLDCGSVGAKESIRSRVLKGSVHLIQKYKKHLVLKGHSGCVNSVLFSSDNETIITGSDDTTVKYFNAVTGDLLSTISTAHVNNIFFAKDIEFSRGSRLLTCAADGRILLTDTMKSGSFLEAFKHRGRAHRIALIPGNPDSFLSTGEDGFCCLFDMRTSDTCVAKTKFKLDDDVLSIYSVAVNPATPSMIMLSGDHVMAQQFDLRKFSNGPVNYYAPLHFNKTKNAHITGVKYSMSGEHILLSYSDEKLYSLDINKHGRNNPSDTTGTLGTSVATDGSTDHSSGETDNFVQCFSGHRNIDTVKSVTYLGSASEFVCSGSDCGHVFIWKSDTGELVKMLYADSRGAINCLTPHSHLPLLATSGLSHDAKVWAPFGNRLSLREDSEDEASDVEENGIPRHRNQAKKVTSKNNSGRGGRNISMGSRAFLRLLLNMMPPGRRVLNDELFELLLSGGVSFMSADDMNEDVDNEDVDNEDDDNEDDDDDEDGDSEEDDYNNNDDDDVESEEEDDNNDGEGEGSESEAQRDSDSFLFNEDTQSADRDDDSEEDRASDVYNYISAQNDSSSEANNCSETHLLTTDSTYNVDTESMVENEAERNDNSPNSSSEKYRDAKKRQKTEC